MNTERKYSIGTRQEMADVRTLAKRSLIYCSNLIGKRVVNDDGEVLGRIEDLVVESSRGTLAFVLLRYDRGDKRFVLPYGSVQVDLEADEAVVSVRREVFDNTPGMAESFLDT